MIFKWILFFEAKLGIPILHQPGFYEMCFFRDSIRIDFSLHVWEVADMADMKIFMLFSFTAGPAGWLPDF